MFKMQIDNHNFKKKNVATDKKFILKKLSLEFQSPKSDILCKIASNIVLYINWNSLELRYR